MKFWNFTVTLTLNTTTHFFTENTPAYDNEPSFQFGCKRISSSVAMVETVIFDYMKSHCDLDLEDNKQILSHDSLVYDDASPIPSLVTKGSTVEKIIMVQMKIQWNVEHSLCPWPWTQHSNASFSQDNPAYDDVPSNQSLLQKDQYFRRYSRK